MTNFEQITKSPEGLARKMVYWDFGATNIAQNNGYNHECYKSLATQRTYKSKKEAVEATINWLNQEAEGEVKSE